MGYKNSFDAIYSSHDEGQDSRSYRTEVSTSSITNTITLTQYVQYQQEPTGSICINQDNVDELLEIFQTIKNNT